MPPPTCFRLADLPGDNNMTKTLKAVTFGSFSLTDGHITLTKDTLHSAKVSLLLDFMVLNHERAMTAQELCEVVDPERISANPLGVLKNLVYRLRKALTAAFGEGEYILTGEESYRWNPDIMLETDADDFSKLSDDFSHEKNNDRLFQLGMGIRDLYRGELLPEYAGSAWGAGKAAFFQSIYMSVMKRVIARFMDIHYYEQAEFLCADVLAKNIVDEEVCSWHILSLLGQKKNDLALDRYYRSTDLLSKNLGIQSSKLLEKAYLAIMKETHDSLENAGDLKDELTASLSAGPFFCEYGIFRNVYKLVLRNRERYGTPAQLVLLTVTQLDKMGEAEKIDQAMLILRNILSVSLRSSDIIARRSRDQFALILTTTDKAAGHKTVSKLKKNFSGHFPGTDILLLPSLTEI